MRPGIPLPLRRQTVLLGSFLILVVTGVTIGARDRPATAAERPVSLPAVRAVGLTIDTLYLGGYTRGSFAEAVRVLASDLSDSERQMVGQHLDKIFLPVLSEDGMGSTGRLRLVYERSRRPDGSTRSIQVLAAEAAVGGKLNTAFFFEQGPRAGYYDEMGRSLEPAPWSRPLAGARVTSPFRMDRMHPILRRILPHTGVDYGAPAGTPVRATADGVVAHAGVRGGYGNLVEIHHPSGFSTRYAHLSRIAVPMGTPLRQGDLVGWVGATGLATGPHLHYEVRRRGLPVDPESVHPGGPFTDLTRTPDWARARGSLSSLLSRAPSILSRRHPPAERR